MVNHPNRGGPRSGQGNRNNNQNNRNHQNNQNQNNNKKFSCNTHGSNATHNTKDCKKPNTTNNNGNNNRNNNQNNSNNNKQNVQCHQCGKSGHKQADCYSNPNNQKNGRNSNKSGAINNSGTGYVWTLHPTPMDVDRIIPGSEAPYCAFCNGLGHDSRLCPNEAAVLACHKSVLRCGRCEFKGHLEQDCKNPIARECHNCHTKGHSARECKQNASAQAADVFRSALKGVSTSRLFGGAEACQMRLEWEQFQRAEAAAGRVIDQQFRFETEKSICDKAAKEVCGHGTTWTSGYKTVFRQYQPMPTPPTAQNTAVGLQSLSSFNPTFAFDRTAINSLRAAGFSMADIKSYELFLQKKAEETQSEHQVAIRKKIDASKTYPKSCVTTAIRTQENWIMENQVLSRSRMDEIKMELAKGTNFWRDPGAISALVQRQVPRCDGCKCNGVVFDRHFCPINPIISEEEILKLEDLPFWGLFVGLPCYCSGQKGYTWMNVPQSELVALEEQEIARKAEACECKRCQNARR